MANVMVIDTVFSVCVCVCVDHYLPWSGSWSFYLCFCLLSVKIHDAVFPIRLVGSPAKPRREEGKSLLLFFGEIPQNHDKDNITFKKYLGLFVCKIFQITFFSICFPLFQFSFPILQLFEVMNYILWASLLIYFHN